MYRLKTIILTAVLFVAGIDASAQSEAGRKIGLYNSVKGFGITASVRSESSPNIYSSLLISTDMQGVYNGDSRLPGIHCNISRNTVLRERKHSEFTSKLFAGTGVSIGYLKDRNRIGAGIMTAVSGSAGYIFSFERPFDITLGLTAEAGIFIRKNSTLLSNELTAYNNGILRAVYPELTIHYRF